MFCGELHDEARVVPHQAFVLLLQRPVTLRGQARWLIRIVARYTPPRWIFSRTTIVDMMTRVFAAAGDALLVNFCKRWCGARWLDVSRHILVDARLRQCPDSFCHSHDRNDPRTRHIGQSKKLVRSTVRRCRRRNGRESAEGVHKESTLDSARTRRPEVDKWGRQAVGKESGKHWKVQLGVNEVPAKLCGRQNSWVWCR